MIYKWLNSNQPLSALAQSLYPPCCALCGAAADRSDLCDGCRQELPWNRQSCPRCALPLPIGVNPAPCARCQQTPPPYDRAWSAFGYRGTLRWLHRRFKFGARLAHDRLLSELLRESVSTALAEGVLTRPQQLLVMPLHARRLASRGFNQSLELVRPTARWLQLSPDYCSLRRLRATQAQSEIPAAERARNVRGAFACTRDLSGQRVVLFDDVVTTGHTVAEAARVLRRAGAAWIEVWSLARTPSQ